MSSKAKLIKEIDDLISENRLEILKILKELRNTEIFKEHSTKVYNAIDVICEYQEKYPNNDEYICELFNELCYTEYEDFKEKCNDLGIELLERGGRQSVHICFKPKNSEDCVIFYLFCSDSSNRFIHTRLDELIENYYKKEQCQIVSDTFPHEMFSVWFSDYSENKLLEITKKINIHKLSFKIENIKRKTDRTFFEHFKKMYEID